MTDPIRMNIARAREVLASPELPWEPAVKQALAQAFIDLTFCVETHERAGAESDAEIDRLKEELVRLKAWLEAAQSELDHLATMVGRVERAAGL